MRILKDFKVPNFKFPKLKMEGISEIDEENLSEPVQKKKNIKYEAKSYQTIKEIFNQSTTKFKDKSFMLEKFDHKEPYTEISYAKFRKDVIGLGTGLIKLLNLKDRRVVIIGENTYHWYVFQSKCCYLFN